MKVYLRKIEKRTVLDSGHMPGLRLRFVWGFFCFDNPKLFHPLDDLSVQTTKHSTLAEIIDDVDLRSP